MGGSGGSGGYSSGRSMSDIAQSLREQEASGDLSAFETEINSQLGKLLSQFNSRDSDLVQRRLKEIKDFLAGELECSVDSLFGGSVAKKTYIEGMSDIDSLILIKDSDLKDSSPSDVLEKLKNILQVKLPHCKVTHGNLAITVKFQDDMEIQLLPGIRHNDKFQISSFTGDSWSMIDPQKFQNKLTNVNKSCDSKLIPVIKLIKALIYNLPDNMQLSGYHVESMGIEAFKNYSGSKNYFHMLSHFFNSAQTIIQKPIKDSTGQSVHVDEYLGAEGSSQRQQIEKFFGIISRRFKNSIGAKSPNVVLEMFEDE